MYTRTKLYAHSSFKAYLAYNRLTLQQRVIQEAEAEKFNELQQLGQEPFNSKMLHHLSSEVHKIVGTDEVDQTSSTKIWNKKAIEQLEKLNNDCSRTADLEGKLHATS